MNANEVIANRANELAGRRARQQRRCTPTTTSTSASRRTTSSPRRCTSPPSRLDHAPAGARRAARRAGREGAGVAGVVKIGRTHLQDATPITLGQVFAAGRPADHGRNRLRAARPVSTSSALGATAVGTGLNAHREFGRRASTAGRCHRLCRSRGPPTASRRWRRTTRWRTPAARCACRGPDQDRQRHAPATPRARAAGSAS